MKKVIFVRHGKSSWNDPYLSDDQRPLKKRGRIDGMTIANILKEENLAIEKIFTSHAVRAKETAIIFKDLLNISEFSKHKELYHAGELEILRFLNKVDNDLNLIMLFGHNPGFTSLNN